MRTRDARRYDRWASLQRITPDDVADFYDRYYVPEANDAHGNRRRGPKGDPGDRRAHVGVPGQETRAR